MPTHKPIIGLNDAFGAQARALRSLQGDILDLFEEAGYEEVIPPILERPDSMQSGAGRFLADQTVVFSDPAGAGTLAIRADMTPQIARIAATRLQHEPILKLCYSGTVMLARPNVRGGSRQQWQTGVEYLGVAGRDGDIDMMHLAGRLFCRSVISACLRRWWRTAIPRWSNGQRKFHDVRQMIYLNCWRMSSFRMQLQRRYWRW